MEIMNSLAIVHITQCLFLKYTHRQTHTCTHRYTVLILSVPSTKLWLVVKHQPLAPCARSPRHWPLFTSHQHHSKSLMPSSSQSSKHTITSMNQHNEVRPASVPIQSELVRFCSRHCGVRNANSHSFLKNQKLCDFMPFVTQVQVSLYQPGSRGKASIPKSRISTEVPISQIIWSI